jgi:tetratricopeptide (TPR) repeat protein
VLAGEGRDEEAAALLREGAGVLRQHETALEGLHLHLGDVLARLGRTADAEAAYREEARAFPDAVPAYTGLSALVRSNGRIEDADAILDVLLRLVPTPDGYAAAARAWTAAGQRARAERVRSEARARLRGADPRPVRPARDTAR